MRIDLDRSGTLEGLERLLAATSATEGVRGILILAAAGNGWTPETLSPLLQRQSLPLFGGVFCRIVYGCETLERGTVVVGLPTPPLVRILPDLTDDSIDYVAKLERRFDLAPLTGRTMFVIVDGMARNISALIEALFIQFGLEINYIGGGAGGTDLVSKPCVITNDGLLQNAAVLALVDLPSGIGVQHGWRPIGGPFRVTEAHRNEVISIEWQPAFDFYRDIIRQDSGQELEAAHFFEVSCSYPFGLARLGAEMIARHPLSLGPGNRLICAGDVPSGSFLHVLKADFDGMVQAAATALDQARRSTPASRATTTLVWDCISRAACMQREFDRELQVIAGGASPTIGALTIGEIANCGKSYLEFYNNTIVVSVLGEP